MESRKPHENHGISEVSAIEPRFFKAVPNGIASFRLPRLLHGQSAGS